MGSSGKSAFNKGGWEIKVPKVRSSATWKIANALGCMEDGRALSYPADDWEKISDACREKVCSTPMTPEAFKRAWEESGPKELIYGATTFKEMDPVPSQQITVRDSPTSATSFARGDATPAQSVQRFKGKQPSLRRK